MNRQIRVGDSKYDFSARNFDPLTPLAPKFPNFATQILLFRLKYTVAVVTHAQNFFTPLGYWVLLAKKQRLGPKLIDQFRRDLKRIYLSDTASRLAH